MARARPAYPVHQVPAGQDPARPSGYGQFHDGLLMDPLRDELA